MYSKVPMTKLQMYDFRRSNKSSERKGRGRMVSKGGGGASIAKNGVSRKKKDRP